MAIKSFAVLLALLAATPVFAAPAAAPYAAPIAEPAAEPVPQNWWQPPPPPPSWQPPAWKPPPPPAWAPPPAPATNPNYCPQACNVFYNNCDKTTAPTCIFPDPLVPRPRSACACRAGYKATGYADGDSSHQWRLPVKGQEYRVWVAEGVKCDTLCKGSGTEVCQEVVILGEHCIGGAP